MAANKRRQDEKHLKILRELGSQPHNKQCFDCHQRGPTYINMTIGSFVCTSCSGILRGLNPPYRVKSISMTSFTPEEIEFIRGKGNEYCRRVWLGTHDSRGIVEPESKDEQRIKDFMIQKYERKRWYVDPSMLPKNQVLPSPAASAPTTPVPEVKPLTALVNYAVKPTGHNRILATSVSNPGLSSSHQNNTHRPSLDLLSEFSGDPFASANSSSSQTANFANFENFNSSVAVDSLPRSQSHSSSLTQISLHNPSQNTFILKRPHPKSSLRNNHSLSFPRPNLPKTWQSFDDSVPPLSKLDSELARISEIKSTSCQSMSDFERKNGTDRHVQQSASSSILPIATSVFSTGTMSSPPSVGSTPMSTASASSQFANFAMSGTAPATSPGSLAPSATSGTTSTTNTLPQSSSSSVVSAPAQDKYAALADLDNLFNSTSNANTNPPEWDGKTSTPTWNVNGIGNVPTGYGNTPANTPSSGFISTGSSPNPFSPNNQQTWTPTQPPPSGFATGNPFAAGFHTPQSNAGSFGQFNSPPSSTGGFPAVNGQFNNVQNGGFPPTQQPTTNTVWPTAGPVTGGWMNFNVNQSQGQTPYSSSNSFAPTKSLTGTQYVWQTPAGNPFMVNSAAIPPRSNSSNPFL
uniref:Arf-GAP domain-containing protein n=1 Tax=Strigamia maritima TaxID=126957 RepID=T1IZ22_STRMM